MLCSTRDLGAAGADGLLVPVAGLAGVALLGFQDAEFEHRRGCPVGVAGADGLLPPVPTVGPFAMFTEQARELTVRFRVDGGVGVAEQACGGVACAAG